MTAFLALTTCRLGAQGGGAVLLPTDHPSAHTTLQDPGQREIYVIGVGASLNSGELALIASGPAATHVKRTFYRGMIPANVQANHRVKAPHPSFLEHCG